MQVCGSVPLEIPLVDLELLHIGGALVIRRMLGFLTRLFFGVVSFCLFFYSHEVVALGTDFIDEARVFSRDGLLLIRRLMSCKGKFCSMLFVSFILLRL